MSNNRIKHNQPILSDETRAIIDRWLAKFPADQRRSATLAALTAAQKQNQGWLTEKLMNLVADYLQIPNVWVYEVATFYDMYDLEAVGKHKIRLCTNVSCMLRGSDKIAAHLKDRLQIGFGETTQDGLFTLKEAECLAACASAPMMEIDLNYHVDLTPEKVDGILEKIRHDENKNSVTGETT